jgi:hypothetical protein
VEGVFCRNVDYGDVTFELGTIRKRLSFRDPRLVWGPAVLGQTILQAGSNVLTVTTHRSAGEQGRISELGLDLLRFRPV